MDVLISVLGKVLGAVAIVLIFATIFALFTMLLWDWLMPTIFGLPEVTLLQAWGINVLSGILFKSSSGSGSGSGSGSTIRQK